MKFVDNYLDKYFSRKVINLVDEHISVNYNKTIQPMFDDVINEWTIEIPFEFSNNCGTIPYIKFYQRKGFIVINYLLKEGWTQLDKDWQLKLQQLKQQLKDLQND